MDINIKWEYKRSSNPYDVVKVIDIIVKEGRCIIKCLDVFGGNNVPFYVSPEDTKKWELY